MDSIFVEYTCTVITRTHSYKIEGRSGTVTVVDFRGGQRRQYANKWRDIHDLINVLKSMQHGDTGNIIENTAMGADAAGDTGSAD